MEEKRISFVESSDNGIRKLVSIVASEITFLAEGIISHSFPYQNALMQTGIYLFHGKRSLKIDRSVKIPWHRLSMGVERS